jgi:hypothetical protein
MSEEVLIEAVFGGPIEVGKIVRVKRGDKYVEAIVTEIVGYRASYR